MLESPVSSNETRAPMTGTIEQIGSDIEQIKAMGTNHIFFGHMFSSIRKDMKKMVEVTKQLARFANFYSLNKDNIDNDSASIHTY